jgi:hypothetical protein
MQFDGDVNIAIQLQTKPVTWQGPGPVHAWHASATYDQDFWI